MAWFRGLRLVSGAAVSLCSVVCACSVTRSHASYARALAARRIARSPVRVLVVVHFLIFLCMLKTEKVPSSSNPSKR